MKSLNPTLFRLSLKKSSSFSFVRASILIRTFSNGCRFRASAAGGTVADGSKEKEPSIKLLATAFPIVCLLLVPKTLYVVLSMEKGGQQMLFIRRIWNEVVRRGDTVIDATCGNGYDTVALLKLISNDLKMGCVYGLDIQNSALENTSNLLRESIVKEQLELVKLFLVCHSRMQDILPKNTPPVRLIAFNLGYLPGGDKATITKPSTTILALQAASRILAPGGLISIVVYVGHLGGMEEFEAILSYVSSLPAEGWNCFKFKAADRPSGPKLVFIFKK